MMGKIEGLCVLIILLVVSCSDKALTVEKDYKRNPGKYLSEILKDTLKVAEFEYDGNRYVKKIKLFNGSFLTATYEYLYNASGQVVQENINYLIHEMTWQHNYTYENQQMVSKITYKIESGNKIPMSLTKYTADKDNNIITCNYFAIHGDSLVKDEVSDIYYFDSKRNLIKAHLSIGGVWENMQEYKYDNKISPFYNLFIPYLKLNLALLDSYECWSANNMTECSTTWLGQAKSFSENHTYSINYKYEGNYTVDKENYYSFKYIDLK